MNELGRQEIAQWLREDDEHRLEELWAAADRARQEHVGDEVHLRGLIEISNYCCRQCGYCGLRAGNVAISRYRMSRDEILECANVAVKYGYGTVVMQAGEDYGIKSEWLADIVRTIKRDTPLAVTLSLGERPESDLRLWREAGANRYLLRFETSDPELYARIHPARQGGAGDEGGPCSGCQGTFSERVGILRMLQRLGYEAGSGVMVGIPGQTYDNLADDILLFRELDLDMIGIGPYIGHPATPLGTGDWVRDIPAGEQVPNTELMTYKAVALTRLVCPDSNIPSTTALATINKEQGRELGLMRGANIVMPNLTPTVYRALYEIYPAKACIDETSEQCRYCLHGRILSIGRKVGVGPGGRRRSEATG